MRPRAAALATFAAVPVLAILALVLSGAALGLQPPSARAQAATRIVSAAIDPTVATVGDRLTFTIVVEHDASLAADGPGFGGDFGGLEVVSVASPADDAVAGRTRTTLAYTLTAFRTGDVLIPPVTVTLRGPDGVDALKTDPLRVSIRSVLAPGDTSLRPLKPQFDIGDDAPSPAVPALVVAAFAALTAFGYVLFRRAASLRPPPVAAPVAPAAPPRPDLAAREALDAIAASGLATSNPPEYYARISTVIRRYLSDRFAFPAFAMTRRELDRHMQRADMDRWVGRVTANLLEEADAAQFAGVVPAIERRDADLTAAYEIVAITSDTPDATSEM
jgi:hypothetical protein